MIVQLWWSRYHRAILWTAILLVTLLGSVRLFNEWRRLLVSSESVGAIDLLLRHGEIPRWFAGLPVYTSTAHAGYPPASYALLFPFFGWLGAWETRWLWGLVTLIELAILILLCLRYSCAQTRLERVLITATLLMSYPIPITIGNGQLGIHVLLMFLGGTLLITGINKVNWQVEFATAMLWLLALTKPSSSMPFFWLALFIPRGLRPALLTSVSYAGLTLFAAAFQPMPLVDLFNEMFKYNDAVIDVNIGAHLPYWFGLLGWQNYTTLGTLTLFVGLGVWMFLNRRADVWLLLGVAGIVARVWTYHRMYDDLLMLPALIALFRIVKRDAMIDATDMLAGILFGTGWCLLMLPGSIVTYPSPWNLPYLLGYPIVWLAMLGFLMIYTRRASISA